MIQRQFDTQTTIRRLKSAHHQLGKHERPKRATLLECVTKVCRNSDEIADCVFAIVSASEDHPNSHKVNSEKYRADGLKFIEHVVEHITP